jgi:iron(III) transport system ATP-binding protein
LTIIENVAFGLRHLRRFEALNEAEKALSRVGLAQYGKSYPHVLSGGEQQRVALARAIVPRPQVMLMDEPFSGLDLRLRESVRSETLALLKETRATTMLVTHDPFEAMELADRILLMRQGRLVQAGTPEQLYRQPVDALAARFFCDLNEITATARRGKVETPLGTFAAGKLQDGQKALVMIRPHGFSRASAEPGVEGYVLSRHFLGDLTQCSVVFRGIEAPLLLRLAAKGAPEAGQSALFSIEPEHVLVFAAGNGDTI